MQGRFARLVVPVAGSDMDDRVLGMLPNLLSSEGGTITFLFVVAVPQAMPLDAELPTDIDRGERALRHAENAARRVLPSRNTAIVTELLQARAVGPAIVDEALVAGNIANTNGLLVILARLVAKGVFDAEDLHAFSDSYSKPLDHENMRENELITQMQDQMEATLAQLMHFLADKGGQE